MQPLSHLESFVRSAEAGSFSAAARLLGRMTGRDDSDDSPPPTAVNSLFETIFRMERHLVGRVPMSPGVRPGVSNDPGD